jgi:hypothetical protein
MKGGAMMNTAQKVIEKFGGQTALANIVGKRQSTIQHWAQVGVIPAKWQGELLKLAMERGVDLQPIDFMNISSDEPLLDETRQVNIPEARWPGVLSVDSIELPCYVLDDGRRVISRTGATDVLTGKRGGGNLESYLGVQALKKYIPDDLSGQMIEISIREAVNKTVMAMEAETFLEICKAYVKALNDEALETERQKSIAMKASMFLASCAKIGLIALIDEATGYQYERAQDALQLKLKRYLTEALRKWEKTFPDELWIGFGRLTSWKGSVTKRPKYWGKFVIELVYEYLDSDVAKWLKENAPKPRHGQNYHQWLSSQYGLKKLLEHIWMLIGIARTCQDMWELRNKMAEMYGKAPVQYTLYLPRPQQMN